MPSYMDVPDIPLNSGANKLSIPAVGLGAFTSSVKQQTTVAAKV